MLDFELDLRWLDPRPCILGWKIRHEFVERCSQSLCSKPDWRVVFVKVHGIIKQLFHVGSEFSRCVIRLLFQFFLEQVVIQLRSRAARDKYYLDHVESYRFLNEMIVLRPLLFTRQHEEWPRY